MGTESSLKEYGTETFLKEDNNTSDNQYDDSETSCGFGRFRPDWLQKYATSRNYLILYSTIGIIQGSYFSYLIAIFSTLEKRYAFKSQISGSVMMFDEITPLILGVFVGYFGGRMHKPRVLAIGTYMSVLCCFVSALPYFLYGESQHLAASVFKNETSVEYCKISSEEQDCNENSRPHTVSAVACLFLGSFLKGFGNISFYAIGLTYLDDNTKKSNTPLYFATTVSFRLFGPILGFLMSSAFLKYYENPYGDPGYGPEDPRWIGAWWIGFVLQGVLLGIITLPLFLFPRRLPSQRSRVLSNTKHFDKENNIERIMGMFKALKRIAANPMYVLFACGTIFSIIGCFGLFFLSPKYMEIQFGLTSSQASLVSGPPALVGMQLTILLGGWIIWKFKPSSKKLLIGHAGVEIVWAIGVFILMIPSCEQFDMRGATKSQTGLNISNDCNNDCFCSTATYSPVCGPDGQSMYFSPCHAGCSAPSSFNASVINDCKCLYDDNLNVVKNEDSVTSGVCKSSSCRGQTILYLILFPVLSALTRFMAVAHTMILLRCVEPQDKSIALGLFEALLSALAFLPFPVIFGALSDSSCLVWESSCGKTGNCWVYDVNKFKNLIHGFSGIFAVISSICFLIICRMHDKIKNLYEDDIEYDVHRRQSLKLQQLE